MNGRPDPVAVIMACVYFAAIGWLVGRVMLREEQRRAAELSELHRNVYRLQDQVQQLEMTQPVPEPEAVKAPSKK